MGLKLNVPGKTYEEFYGRNIEQMPELIAGGMIPMSTAQLMQRRIGLRNSDIEVKSSYMDNWFDTGDAVIYHPNGRVKIVLDSEDLRAMTPDTPRNYGALITNEDVYNALEGEEFKKGKLGKVDKWLSKKQVKAHPVWKVLARDQALLDHHVDLVFAEVKEQFGHDTAMGIFLSSVQGNTPEMRAWCVGRLMNGSYANGGDGLGNHNGRFIGIEQKL